MTSTIQHPRPLGTSLAQGVKVLATLIVAVLAAVISTSAFAGDTFKGQKVYAANCSICHGQDGRGVMPGTPNLATPEAVMKPDFTLLASIRAGRNAMPAYQGILSDRDIMDVIAYVRTLR
jgi:cytochrome c6